MSLPLRIDFPLAPTQALAYSHFATDGDTDPWLQFESDRLTAQRPRDEPHQPDRVPSGLDGVTLAQIVRELSAEVADDET